MGMILEVMHWIIKQLVLSYGVLAWLEVYLAGFLNLEPQVAVFPPGNCWPLNHLSLNSYTEG